jgi:alkyl hydroperoxide reductase subunit AhpF
MISARLAPWLGVLGLGAGGGILLNSTQEQEGEHIMLAAAVPSRQQQVAALSTSRPNQPFDLLVIGGGATGTGIAVDAATRFVLMQLVAADQVAEQQAYTTSAACWQSTVHIQQG